jgi:chromosome condensin MukBEF ATPase and DNA-binding subunit MukB
VTSEDDEWKSCSAIIYNVDKAWEFVGSAVQIENPVVLPGAVDEVARALATKANDQARIANSQASQAASEIGNLKSQISKLPVPLSEGAIEAIAWRKAVDATGRPEFLAQIKEIAQTTLIDAISYAKRATAATSRLRALIEQVMEKK